MDIIDRLSKNVRYSSVHFPQVFKKAARVLFRFDVLTFLLAFGICGMLWGFLENYLFWYLEDMGSTKLLMGLSLAVGTSSHNYCTVHMTSFN